MSYVIALTGFPGVGKLTVAQAIKKETESGGEKTLIVGSHWINNPIFGLIEQDGITPLPVGIWEQVGAVNEAVFNTLKLYTPRNWNIVLTAYISGHRDAGWISEVEAIAAARDATFLPVRLVCDVDEHARRITEPQRRDQMKSIDPDEPRKLASLGAPYDPGPGSLTVDITERLPEATATLILSTLTSHP